jgi:putative membrane protein
MTVTDLPKLYTIFNACALLHIILGLFMIKQGQKKAHVASMIIALLFSTAFLGCYLYYHYHAGHVQFAGTGLSRPLYFTILLTHIPLAILTVPLVIMTVVPALQQRFDKHKRVAKWTVPVWLYVSFTGIIIYLMCYVWYGPPIRA